MLLRLFCFAHLAWKLSGLVLLRTSMKPKRGTFCRNAHQSLVKTYACLAVNNRKHQRPAYSPRVASRLCDKFESMHLNQGLIRAHWFTVYYNAGQRAMAHTGSAARIMRRDNASTVVYTVL